MRHQSRLLDGRKQTLIEVPAEVASCEGRGGLVAARLHSVRAGRALLLDGTASCVGVSRHHEPRFSLPFPGKNTADVAFGDAQLTGDRASGLLGIGGPSGDDLALGQPLNRRRTAQPDALGAGAGETGMDALLDDRALELSEHAEHLKQGAAGRRRGIDALHMKIEIDAVGADLLEERSSETSYLS